MALVTAHGSTRGFNVSLASGSGLGAPTGAE